MLNNVRLVVDFSTAKYERFFDHFCTSVNNFKDFQNLYPTQEVGKHEKSSQAPIPKCSLVSVVHYNIPWHDNSVRFKPRTSSFSLLQQRTTSIWKFFQLFVCLFYLPRPQALLARLSQELRW